MITCQLTKLETALDQIKKAYPKLVPADAALVASALSITGRHALAKYETETYKWPDQIEKLSSAMIPHLALIKEGIEANAPKRPSKTAEAEEPISVSVGLAPNLEAGEKLLDGREDLKNLLGEILDEGVEFVYSPSDIGWQWALDRVNWNTVTGFEIGRKIKIRCAFTEGAVGVETGTQTKKRATKKVVEAEPEPEVVEA